MDVMPKVLRGCSQAIKELLCGSIGNSLDRVSFTATLVRSRTKDEPLRAERYGWLLLLLLPFDVKHKTKI